MRPFFPSLIIHVVNNLLSKNDIIESGSPREETILVRPDNLTHDRPKSVDEHFRYYFEGDVEKRNRLKVSRKFRDVFLGNQRHESLEEVLADNPA